MTPARSRRSVLLLVLVLVTVLCLGTVAVIVATRGAGDGIGDRLQSLQDEGSVSDEVREREELLALSREFATRFNTYDESMLDEAGHLPEYAEVEDLMTPKFGGVFADNVGYAEETVSQLGAASTGTVYAVGVASQDEDSAVVLVAGTVELSYPYPEDAGNGGGDGGTQDEGTQDEGTQDEGTQDEGTGEEPRVSTGPQRFRYELSLVKIDGEWLVDDLDDVDDGLPPFSQPGIPEDSPSPSVPPTDAPSQSETTEPSGEGSR